MALGRRRSEGSRVLTAIRLVHTLAWFSIESCMAYVLWAGLAGRSDRRTAVAAGVVAGESLIFAANRCRCPLTQLAERFGAARGSVTDIYLPRWFARNLPAIHVPLIVLAGYLHARNLASASDEAGAAPPGWFRRRACSCSATTDRAADCDA